jgi:hypothetical protein
MSPIPVTDPQYLAILSAASALCLVSPRSHCNGTPRIGHQERSAWSASIGLAFALKGRASPPTRAARYRGGGSRSREVA